MMYMKEFRTLVAGSENDDDKQVYVRVSGRLYDVHTLEIDDDGDLIIRIERLVPNVPERRINGRTRST